jgi:hypothetical protein
MGSSYLSIQMLISEITQIISMEFIRSVYTESCSVGLIAIQMAPLQKHFIWSSIKFFLSKKA